MVFRQRIFFKIYLTIDASTPTMEKPNSWWVNLLSLRYQERLDDCDRVCLPEDKPKARQFVFQSFLHKIGKVPFPDSVFCTTPITPFLRFHVKVSKALQLQFWSTQTIPLFTTVGSEQSITLDSPRFKQSSLPLSMPQLPLESSFLGSSLHTSFHLTAFVSGWLNS